MVCSSAAPLLGVGDVQYKAHDQLGLAAGDGGDLCSLQPLVRPRPGLSHLSDFPPVPDTARRPALADSVPQS